MGLVKARGYSFFSKGFQLMEQKKKTLAERRGHRGGSLFFFHTVSFVLKSQGRTASVQWTNATRRGT